MAGISYSTALPVPAKTLCDLMRCDVMHHCWKKDGSTSSLIFGAKKLLSLIGFEYFRSELVFSVEAASYQPKKF